MTLSVLERGFSATAELLSVFQRLFICQSVSYYGCV